MIKLHTKTRSKKRSKKFKTSSGLVLTKTKENNLEKYSKEELDNWIESEINWQDEINRAR